MSELRLMVALARAKQRFPALRLTHIICNATNKNDPFYVTDEQLANALERYRAGGAAEPPRMRRSADKPCPALNEAALAAATREALTVSADFQGMIRAAIIAYLMAERP